MLFYATSVHFLIYLFWIRAVRMVSVGETEQYHSILWDMQQHFIQILQYNGDNNFYNATRWCNANAIYCVSWVVVTSSKSACWTVWYGVAHNSIFLHLFSILLLRLSVRENTATAKSHFTGGKTERERWLPYIFTGMPTFYPGFVYIKVNSNIQLTFALLLHYECEYFGFSRGKKKMENYSLHFRT